MVGSRREKKHEGKWNEVIASGITDAITRHVSSSCIEMGVVSSVYLPVDFFDGDLSSPDEVLCGWESTNCECASGGKQSGGESARAADP